MTTETEGWLQKIPKTELTWAFAWLIAFGVVGRYLMTGDAPDGTLLAWSGALIVAAAGLQVGMRAATKADVIVAQAQAKEIEKTGEHAAAIRPALSAYAGAHPRDRMSEEGP